MEIIKINNHDLQINDGDTVRVIIKGDYIEQIYNTHRNYCAHTKKLNSTQYLNCQTGEVCNYQKKSKKRIDNLNSVMKTMKKIRDLIQTNVRSDNYRTILFITLTYREIVRDADVLRKDFDKFYKKICRYSKKYGLCTENNKPKYLSVIEPQERGAYHYHIFLFFDFENPYIPNKSITKMWGKGFCKTESIKDYSNVANYLIAYLSDIEIDEEKLKFFSKNHIKNIEKDGVNKSLIKGGRLNLYPAQFKIIRYSQNLEHPIKKNMSVKETQNLIKGKKLVYEVSYKLKNEEYETEINRKVYR